MSLFIISAVLFTLALIFPRLANAITLPNGFTDTLIVNGITTPTSMAFAPDGRIFVTQKGGALRIVKNGALLPTPFLNLTVNSGGERGLLGVTFDPNFATNKYVYVYYTTSSPTIHNRVSRFTANGDVAVAGSEIILLELNDLSATNHNGGSIHFGNDGKLYIAVGENAVGANSQTLNNMLGKILRINSDGTIPTDNPFYTTASGNNRSIYVMGLRNPFTFAPDLQSSKIFINDVGQSSFEEVNEMVKGANYGWPSCEGTCSNPSFVNPIYSYGRSVGQAITGGTFYRGTQFPSSYNGNYFFSDYLGNWIKLLDSSTHVVSNFASNVASPVDLDVGPDGALYYISINTGELHKISSVVSPTPTSSVQTLGQVHINAGLINIVVGKSFDLSALAYNNQGAPIWDNVQYAWGISSTNSIGRLTQTTGTISTFVAQNAGYGDLYVTATYNGESVTKSIPVDVTDSVIPKIKGNANGDNKVNLQDYNILVTQFLQTGTNLAADFNNSGKVDYGDYNILVTYYAP